MKCLIEPFQEVKREFDFGAWDVGPMRFKGIQLTQMANNEILIDMEQYKHELQQNEVSQSDKATSEPQWPWKHWMAG